MADGGTKEASVGYSTANEEQLQEIERLLDLAVELGVWDIWLTWCMEPRFKDGYRPRKLDGRATNQFATWRYPRDRAGRSWLADMPVGRIDLATRFLKALTDALVSNDPTPEQQAIRLLLDKES